MAENLSTVPAEVENEAEAPETETQEASAETEGETSETEQPEGGGEGGQQEQETEQQAEEEVEFDFGGNKFKAPKSAIPENIRVELDKFTKGTWADYTRKSQDVAEQRRSVEAAGAAVQKLRGLNDEALNTYSRGLSVRQEIEQLQKVDIQAMWQSPDPAVRDRARMISDSLSAKQAEFQGIVQKVNEIEGSLNAAQQQETVRRATEGKAIVEKAVPGFATKHLPEVIDYVVKNYGIPKDVAERDWPFNPGTTLMAHKAMLYDRMKAQAGKTAPKPAPAQPVNRSPIKGAGAAGTTDVSKMSEAQMARHLGLPVGR